MITSNIVEDFEKILKDKYITFKMLSKISGINENEIFIILKNIKENKIKISILLNFFKKTGFKIVFSLDGETTEEHSLGYILKYLMKRKKISKKKLAEILGEDYIEVSLGIKNIYENKGDMNQLLKYVNGLKIDFRYWFE